MPARHETRLREDRVRGHKRLAAGIVVATVLNLPLAGGLARFLRPSAVDEMPRKDTPMWVFNVEDEPAVVTESELAQLEPELEPALPPPDVSPERLQEPAPTEPERRVEPDPPEPEPEPEPETEPPKPNPVLPQNLKMVEQPDVFDEETAPDDADYLSNVNRDVELQTRARVTNMHTDATQVEVGKDSPKSPESGNAGDERHMDADPQESANKPEPGSHAEDEREPGPSNRDEPAKSAQPREPTAPLLQMRAQRKITAQAPSQARDELARTADDGSVPDTSEARVARKAQRARRGRRGARSGLLVAPNPRQLAELFGHRPGGSSGGRKAGSSAKPGVWDEARRHYQSPLENMVPEVQVGNQTALRSRKHPFARYIATIHRKIHELWAYGILGRWDTLPARSELSDRSLWSRIEVVINPDGTVDKTTLVHFSGSSTFDGSAKEVIWAAGPFPEPPAAIRSGNGKVYMHWTFHRNERACGTFGVMPYILDNEGAGDRPDPHAEVILGPSSGAAAVHGHGHAHAGQHEQLRRLQRKPVAEAAQGPTIPPSSGKESPGSRKLAPAPGGGPASTGRVPQASSRPLDADTDVTGSSLVRSSAIAWLRPLLAGKTGNVVLRSALPFKSGDAIVARTGAELKSVLTSFAAEAKGSSLVSVRAHSASSLRKLLGSVPAGVRAGPNRAYAWVRTNNDQFVLLLQKRFGAWRVVGLSR